MSVFDGFFDGLGFEEEMTPAEHHAMDLAIADDNLIIELRDARIRRGLTEDQLGDILGVSGEKVREFEGLQAAPTLATIRRYAHALGVSISHTVTDRQESLPLAPSSEAPAGSAVSGGPGR
ncbi:helix-turn-helix domain-containing protein [Curtobacterium sp. MCSS17_016]|uniref:helix-turn-helix domain-containing protein n=1 Tax=Curtobacterium sp. MCSS17_016 TaxID=2175644 RepID=UPI000DA6F387|nr:helix-turn-helix domain-containing protein [Curtobacterium sp. MCSS17_016]WIE81331.1 helix-turn-helix domain-containing protein [Curtobacterium sp. MCSS17_016]